MLRAVGATLCGLFALAGGGGAVWAGDWEITPALSVNETATDNATLANDDQERHFDLITEVSPELRIRGRGGRTSLDLDFAHRQLFFKNTDQDDSFQRLAARGQIELWDRVAFIDGLASMTQRVVDNRAASSDSAAGQVNNRTNVRSFDVSPYFLHHFGTWVETETRFRYIDVAVADDVAADTRTFEESFRADSGRTFQRLRWSVVVDNFKEIRDDDTASRKSFTADNDYTFVVNRQVSILAGVGYEDIEDNTLIEQPKGVTWNAGFALNPSRRSSLRATYGKRFGDDNFAFDGSYQLSSRTRVTANYTDTLQTTQRRVAQDLSFLGTDALGNLIDTRTGLPYTGSTDEFSLQTDTFHQRRFSAALVGSRKRNRFSLATFWENRQTDRTGADDTIIGVTGNLSRDLSRRSTGNLLLSYRNTQFEGATDRTDNLYVLSGNVTYEIFRNTRAVLTYSRTQRDSDVDVNDLTENAVVLGLRREF